MKVAIIGTVGVPANYGGFETLVENLIGDNCSKDIEYTVFCSSKSYVNKTKYYKNAALKYIPFKANDIQSIPYDIVSLLWCIRRYDIILYLGLSVPIFKLYKRIFGGKIIVNIDGISKDREKYRKVHKWYLSFLTKNKIQAPDTIISDNLGIQQYAKKEYGRDSYLIAYGGDQAIREVPEAVQRDILNSLGLQKNCYSISVCRIEPENNCHITLEAHAITGKNLIFIGNWNKNEYGKKLKEKYSKFSNIIVHEPIYDLDTLFALRNNSDVYIHGHKVGGTNPSLVEAMFFGKPILCYDVIFNRATTENQADYFCSIDDLVILLNEHKNSGSNLLKIAKERYTWKKIVGDYESVYRNILNK